MTNVSDTFTVTFSDVPEMSTATYPCRSTYAEPAVDSDARWVRFVLKLFPNYGKLPGDPLVLPKAFTDHWVTPQSVATHKLKKAIKGFSWTLKL